MIQLKCDTCGKPVNVSPSKLIYKNHYCSRQCKHSHKLEERALSATKHGQSGTRTYRIWCGMKGRCLNHNHHAYHSYGGRGISVCERWLSYENFAADMGECPEKMTIDRIDNDGNYEPGNCRWTGLAEQQRNRSNNHRYDFDGKSMILSEWAEHLGLSVHTLKARVKYGWPIEHIFDRKKHQRGTRFAL